MTNNLAAAGMNIQDIFVHTLKALDEPRSKTIPRAAATGPRTRDVIAPEGSAPAADAGTAGEGTLYPMTCAARYYDAASRILEDEPRLCTHENADELGRAIQRWIEETRNNWEP